jgi:hypothetical protein
MESSSGDEVDTSSSSGVNSPSSNPISSSRSRTHTPPGGGEALMEELKASSDNGGRNWKVRVSTKSKKQEQKEQKSGRKGLRKKGKDLGKEERKRQKNGEGGALICFKVIKTNQYGKRQKRYYAPPRTNLLKIEALPPRQRAKAFILWGLRGESDRALGRAGAALRRPV